MFYFINPPKVHTRVSSPTSAFKYTFLRQESYGYVSKVKGYLPPASGFHLTLVTNYLSFQCTCLDAIM